MAAPNVDLVLVIDASASMKPCFDGLREHLTKVLQPLQGHVSNVEFCLLAQSVGLRGRQLVHDHRFLGCRCTAASLQRRPVGRTGSRRRRCAACHDAKRRRPMTQTPPHPARYWHWLNDGRM